jgi:O-antigen/teichoic acid export membrane protein
VETDQSHRTKSLQARIFSGSVVLLSGSGLTTAINLAYNLVIARYLGPKSFGHATVVYTLLTLLSAVTLSYQIVCSKIVAKVQSEEGKTAAYRMFHRSAWACGLGVALVLLVFQRGIADYLNLPDSILVALLAIGAAFYVPLGCRRGYIQGTYGFRGLATNLVVEGAVRLGGSYLLVLMGLGVRGVIGANAAAVAVAYLVIPPKLISKVASPISLWNAVLEMGQALFFFSGQVLINNCDIVLVKHLFSAEEAGLYAAIAMVGRVIFSFSQAVVNSTFPLVAGTRREERRNFQVLATSLGLVVTIGSVLAIALYLTPPWIWSTLFGSGFRIAGPYNLSYLQALYAFKTVLYSMCVVMITYEMSDKITNTSIIQLLFSGVFIEAILRYHSSLREVILVQILVILGLLAVVVVPFIAEAVRQPRMPLAERSYQPIRLIRQVSEDEVIAEFLKSDFHRPEFQEFRHSLRDIIARPNFNDSNENAKRRALLFRRHLALWTEIPKDVSWYEVEINPLDINHIRAFPRAQWRKLARGNYSAPQVASRMRELRDTLPKDFLFKIDRIAEEIVSGKHGFGAVILIGINESEPLTVLDGNHRLMAAISAAPDGVAKLRVLCGLSSRMNECCWYSTNVMTLFRYAIHLICRAIKNPETEFAMLLRSADAETGGGGVESRIAEVSSE